MRKMSKTNVDIVFAMGMDIARDEIRNTFTQNITNTPVVLSDSFRWCRNQLNVAATVCTLSSDVTLGKKHRENKKNNNKEIFTHA